MSNERLPLNLGLISAKTFALLVDIAEEYGWTVPEAGRQCMESGIDKYRGFAKSSAGSFRDHTKVLDAYPQFVDTRTVPLAQQTLAMAKKSRGRYQVIDEGAGEPVDAKKMSTAEREIALALSELEGAALVPQVGPLPNESDASGDAEGEE